ncbi:MAG: glycosyltransferase family 2 protein [Candidatus Daviesbacteria bacterium]|nr:glycosyltransferase family 2 protein [Candidatus Daviesbacteria bacterium]
MNIFIVIPVFNESKKIEGVLTDLKGLGLPIIVVDDGSKDSTLEKVKKFQVTVLRHRINLGKGAALKTGCEVAISMGADAIIMMDSDGQHKGEDLPKFINALETKKVDIVFGSRNLSMGVPLVRFLGNKFASVLIVLFFKIYVSDLICGYRALTKKAYMQMNLKSSGYGIETEMVVKVAKLKLRYCEIPIETIYYDRFKGVTIMDAFGVLFNVVKWRIFK